MHRPGHARRRDEQAAPVDARDRADATLRRARSRDSAVVTPDVARSPADSQETVKIPRHLVTAADPRDADPDSTQVIRIRELPQPRRA